MKLQQTTLLKQLQQNKEDTKMKHDILNVAGTKVADIELNDAVFGIEPHQQAMFDAVIAQQSSLRQGTHKVKTRTEVAGGGRKP